MISPATVKAAKDKEGKLSLLLMMGKFNFAICSPSCYFNCKE